MRKINKKERDIALSWVNGYLTHAQVIKKYKTNAMGAYILLARSLKEIIKHERSK